MRQAVAKALRREKLCGKVTANRRLTCIEVGIGDIVSNVAKVSHHGELTVQPGHVTVRLSDPHVLRLALEEVAAPLDV